MATNIHEQIKEISVLRAIGMRNSDLRRVYTYEAFALVLSASLMGMAIGTVVGWTMSLQRMLFTEIYVPFIFPVAQFIAVLMVAFLSGIMASAVPISGVLSMKIAKS